MIIGGCSRWSRISAGPEGFEARRAAARPLTGEGTLAKLAVHDPRGAPRIALLDSQILMATRQYAALRWKGLFLKLAMLSLAMAVPVSALGTTVE
jgi:hypothetical protein